MMKRILKTTGINFHKLDNLKELKISKFRDLEARDSMNILISSGSFYEILIYNDLKCFEIKSSILKEVENDVEFRGAIKQVVCSEQNCFMLHNDGRISLYNVKLKSLNSIQISLKSCHETLTQISSTLKCVYGISNSNRLYQILPQMEMIYEFRDHQKIMKIESGLEHLLMLTKNGDIYGYGCSLRGQLGTGTISPDESVKLIDALGGIKIVDIGCSAFSSVAVSSFGDVYSFGWNTNGQLGIKKTNDRCKQVYTLPELVELENEFDPVCKVYCGHKHTILRTEKNKLLASGLNNYGQLGINSEANEIDKFTEIDVEYLVNDETTLCCGHFNTYLISFK